MGLFCAICNLDLVITEFFSELPCGHLVHKTCKTDRNENWYGKCSNQQIRTNQLQHEIESLIKARAEDAKRINQLELMVKKLELDMAKHLTMKIESQLQKDEADFQRIALKYIELN